MRSPDILLAVKPVVEAFNRLSIPYYVGGSIASSVYGVARATMDVDIVADLASDQVAPLVELLRDEYYLSEQAIDNAVTGASSFNLIHLETMMKVDVFVPKKEPYQKSAMSRRLKDRLAEDDRQFVLCLSSPEDLILSKLRWYDTGGRVSERQWLDVLGVIKVQTDSLDRDYLITWSKTLGLFDSLKQAFAEVGMEL
jgi:hypothetical protein